MDLNDFLKEWNSGEKTILVHTSGSTGEPKPMLVEKSRMLSSARMTCDFLGLKSGDSALLCMPLDYIAGKMMVVRSIERGLNLISVKPSNHPLAEIDKDQTIDFAAMVPSQVYCSLQVDCEKEKLKAIKHLIIGGGAVSGELEKELKSFPNNVWSTYGMTETLSHIALRKLSGQIQEKWYTPFDNVSLSHDADGCLVIDAPSVSEVLVRTNDIVEFNMEDGKRFRIIGRKDNVICSGGIKLHMEEIEEKLKPYIRRDFCISKRKDDKFGEIAILLLECRETRIDDSNCNLSGAFYDSLIGNVSESFSKLDPYSVPKSIKLVERIPLTDTGKINRKESLSLARSWTDEVWDSTEILYKKIIDHPFIRELASGSLPYEKFQKYLIQDSFYLQNYSKEMKLLASVFNDRLFDSLSVEAMEGEKAMHDLYLSHIPKEVMDNAMPSDVTLSYNRHCMGILSEGNPATSIAAILPCMWIYGKVGKYISSISDMTSNPYRRWIQEYSNDDYDSSVSYMLELADRIADNSASKVREQMTEAFLKSVEFEYEFWNYAY